MAAFSNVPIVVMMTFGWLDRKPFGTLWLLNQTYVFSVPTKEPDNFESLSCLFVIQLWHLNEVNCKPFRSSCVSLFKSNLCVFNPNQKTRHISNLFLNQTYVFSISTKEPGSFESTVSVKKIEQMSRYFE